ncbi:MAG TPA: M28 family peptidase [Pyrinomonadaceae bacterium]|nr:M28 family peptidase [Pyrinomonadaceae bacterium]
MHRTILCCLTLSLILTPNTVFTSPGLTRSAKDFALLGEPVIAALSQELSGETAKRNLEYIARRHRMRGSRGFRAAADHIAAQLRQYGLADARVEQFPADGKLFYGTQRSRPPWDAEFAELWELRQTNEGWTRHAQLASWEAMPVTLAQDSESGETTADLVDVGNGTSERDYAGKDVRGKIVLAAAQPGPVAQLAIERFGAAGIVSYAQNQRTAWWAENENLVRWGHLDTFAKTPTFAFMISLKQARNFQQRLARGEQVRLQAKVKAGKHSGSYDVVTATIPGADQVRRGEEIAFSCHLDHQRPGANDNASGCVAILEVARTLNKLINEGRIARPARTIRFIWPPEIEGTLALLNGRPELPARIKAVIHMDMVGGGPETKAIFHITRGPGSLPSFINDVAEYFGQFVNEQSARFAKGTGVPFPLVAPEGGKEALLAEVAEFSMGSDHQIYTDSSFGIPAIYLNDWPDRYIHTNFDTPANVDPTKLKRAAFIGAASAYFLADLKPEHATAILDVVQSHSLRRTATMLERRTGTAPEEAANLTRFHLWRECMLVDSMGRFFPIPENIKTKATDFLGKLESLVGGVQAPAPAQRDGRVIFRRDPKVKGPMSAFGYDYFTDHFGAEREASIRLLQYQGARGSGGEYAYEVLNFVDGRRNAQEIRDAVSAIYGPVPLELVVEYLKALESIRILEAIR